MIAVIAALFAVNWIVQVARKPTELFFPVSGALNKTPAETWRAYGPIFRAHSTAVGMYQITDATYAQARRLCIHDHMVSEDCWFNFLYLRTVPSHAVEMTAAFLDRAVERRMRNGTLQQKQDLAALIHLCGENVRPGTRRCGEHDAQAYLAQVNAMQRLFRKLSSGKPEYSW